MIAAGAHGTEGFKEKVDELRSSLCDYVQTLKEAGLPAEAVVIAVKGLAARAGLPHSGVRADTLLVERVVRWCIEEYYRPA